MTRAYRVVKEVFVNVKCQSEQREQTSSKGKYGITVVGTLNQASDGQ
jgi:hypothetical protein